MNWRHRQPQELDFELLGLLVSCGSLGAAILWLKLALPRPVCLFHIVTHHACLTCGATRCLDALSSGQFTTAFYWNPLFFLILIGVAFFDLYALVVLIFNLPRLYFKPESKAVLVKIRWLILIILLCNWIYLWQAGI